MCQKGEIIALISPFCDVFRSFLFGLYLFHHPEEISTPYLGDVCFCKSMFQQTDGDIDEIIVPIASFDPASTVGQAQSFLKELTHLMGVDVTVAMGTDAENNVFAQMTGDTLGILIGRRGETLDALQYLTSLRINKGQDHYTRVTLDTENYRAKREDTLIRLANRMANRAVKAGRKVSLEPMNPYERRVIHSALQPNELVDTHSEGEEPKRHIVITLRK